MIKGFEEYMKQEITEITQEINNGLQRMKEAEVINMKHISDGYHTFDELYHHRMMLFAVICNTYKEKTWKSELHHDGTMYENMFIVGITTDQGDYSYHYDLKDWGMFNVEELMYAPKWDGHEPKDITRLLTLIGGKNE